MSHQGQAFYVPGQRRGNVQQGIPSGSKDLTMKKTTGVASSPSLVSEGGSATLEKKTTPGRGKDDNQAKTNSGAERPGQKTTQHVAIGGSTRGHEPVKMEQPTMDAPENNGEKIMTSDVNVQEISCNGESGNA